MSIQKLRSLVRRGTLLGAAFALLAGALVPTLAYADALNPLTERSLTLSSSSPGWDFLDGSGNTEYAPAGSGANGQKTGNTFQFKVSTDSSAGGSKLVKGFGFQYCIHSAGDCTGPGNNAIDTGTTHITNTAALAAGNKTSDLDVVTSSPSELTGTSLFDLTKGELTAQGRVPLANNSEGNFIVLKKDVGDTNWSQSTGWAMAADDKQETGDIGTKNYISLVNTGGGLSLHGEGQVKVIFFATNTNYITNPGAGSFFVKINDYNSSDPAAGFTDANRIDGGVTVANVMNRSIQIQTKVLETMDFSVGTVDPYTLDDTQLSTATTGVASGHITTHGQCDPILTSLDPSDNTKAPNTLSMGDETNENSLSTSATYGTHSYWRLSSNSSAGATVYYSGATLHNTEDDKIAGIGLTASTLSRGTPQFGLAIANGTQAANATGPFAVNYDVERDGTKGVFEDGADNSASGIVAGTGKDASVSTDITAGGLSGYHDPQLWPLVPRTDYQYGAGSFNDTAGLLGTGYGSTSSTKFAFDEDSTAIPVPIADESTTVVDCVTAKMRYVANIAATTPAGIYTTKINYIAAPQY
jgi:hypothetical protein